MQLDKLFVVVDHKAAAISAPSLAVASAESEPEIYNNKFFLLLLFSFHWREMFSSCWKTIEHIDFFITLVILLYLTGILIDIL